MKLVNAAIGTKSDFDLRERIYNAVAIIILVVDIISVFWNNTLGILGTTSLLLGFSSLIFVGIYYLGRFKRKLFPHVLVLTTLVLLSILWLTSDGVNGSTPLIYLVAILMFVAISKSKDYLIYILYTGISLAMVYYIETQYPDIVLHYPSDELRRNDLFFSFFFSGIVIVIMVVIFKRNYDTERETINKQKIELEESNRAKDKLFSVISHDLRSPFQGILGISQLMVNDRFNEDPEEMKIMANALHGSAEKTMVLVDNLLNWAKVQQHKIEVRPDDILLFAFMHSNMEFLQHQYATKRINIILDVPKNLHVIADGDMLQLIVRNLLSNAFKFTEQGGSVRIIAKKIAPSMVEISFVDSGVGMSEDQLKLLFSTEFISGATGLSGEKSTGLGLSLCKDFVELQGGTIRAESKPGEGSSFIFTLPAA